MGFLQNLDLFTVGICIAGIGVLGFTVFFNNPKSITNRSFLFFSLISIFWGITNYVNYKFTSEFFVLWSLRLLIFFAVWHAFSLLQFICVFPTQKDKFSKAYKYVLVPVVILVSILTLTPLVFSRIVQLGSLGQVSTVEKGPGILLFLLLTVFNITTAFIVLVKKIKQTSGQERVRLNIVAFGLLVTFILLGLFNFLLPALYDRVDLIPFGALFIFPFIAFTSYAIYKHKLFNVKVAASGALVFVLTIVTFSEVILSGNNISLIVYRSSVFILVLVFGILLIRGVLREVEQREKLQVLTDELSAANEKLKELDRAKTEFVSIASHQLRAPLTAIKGYASLALEGSFGPMTEKVHGAIDVIFQSSQRLVQLIEDFLNITRIELGKMKYDMVDFDFKKLVEGIVNELRPSVEKAGLKITFSAEPGVVYTVHADQGKMSQVVTNLVDNATKYTKQGSIAVSLTKNGSKTQLRVKDTGVGLDQKTIDNLFQKFVRAADASKANATGTGLGLFVARQMIEAHGGKAWAESEGTGKGSTFIVEI